jgi:hypothetical protein
LAIEGVKMGLRAGGLFVKKPGNFFEKGTESMQAARCSLATTAVV